MSAVLYYDEVIYLIMLMMWVCAAIGTIVFLYVIFYVCLSAFDKLGRWLYKKLGPVDNWFLTTVDCEKEIHCDCSMEEIEKSFIEDVESVKDLLPDKEDKDEQT